MRKSFPWNNLTYLQASVPYTHISFAERWNYIRYFQVTPEGRQEYVRAETHSRAIWFRVSYSMSSRLLVIMYMINFPYCHPAHMEASTAGTAKSIQANWGRLKPGCSLQEISCAPQDRFSDSKWSLGDMGQCTLQVAGQHTSSHNPTIPATIKWVLLNREAKNIFLYSSGFTWDSCVH